MGGFENIEDNRGENKTHITNKSKQMNIGNFLQLASIVDPSLPTPTKSINQLSLFLTFHHYTYSISSFLIKMFSKNLCNASTKLGLILEIILFCYLIINFY